MFFSAFPKTAYTFDFKAQSPAVVTNIFSRIRMRTEVLQNAYAYYKYQILDGETPEIVSYNEYGSADYHWVLCLVNGLTDPQFDFPLDQSSLENMILAKYGYTTITQAISTIHHYKLVRDAALIEVYGPTTSWSEDYIVTLDQYNYSTDSLETKALNIPTTVTSTFRANNANANSATTSTLSITSTYLPVYVYDYEQELNEAKRVIKILKQTYLQSVVNELDAVLNG